MSPTKKYLPYLALGSGVLALSFSALFVRWADAPGPVMSLYRIGIATLIMLPLFAGQRRHPERVKLTPAILIFPALAGLASAGDQAIWTTAIHSTSVANATLLNNTAPLWVSLAAWLFFRERLQGAFWVGLGLTLSGALLVLGSDFLLHPSLSWGDFLALFSGLFYAAYFLITQRGRQELDTLSFTWLAALSSTLGLLIICLVMRFPLSGYTAGTYLVFLAAALVSQVGGYLSISYALGHLPASAVSPTMIAQPVSTALLAIPLLGEGLRLPQLLGGLAVLAGIFLVHKSREVKESVTEQSLKAAGC